MRDWMTWSNYADLLRNEYDLTTFIYDHFTSIRIFTLMVNKIFVRAPKI